MTYPNVFCHKYSASFCFTTCVGNSILSHLQAFAWWPELLAEHAEKFLSLYSVDMDSALEAQPQDSWDSFPLFQLLNNSLRNDSKIFRFLLIVCIRFFIFFLISLYLRNVFVILKIRASVPLFMIYILVLHFLEVRHFLPIHAPFNSLFCLLFNTTNCLVLNQWCTSSIICI